MCSHSCPSGTCVRIRGSHFTPCASLLAGHHAPSLEAYTRTCTFIWGFTHDLWHSYRFERLRLQQKKPAGFQFNNKKKKHSAILSGARFTCCSALLVLTKGGTKVIPRVTLGTVSKAFAHGHRLYPCQIMEPPFFSPLLFLNLVILALRQILKN